MFYTTLSMSYLIYLMIHVYIVVYLQQSKRIQTKKYFNDMFSNCTKTYLVYTLYSCFGIVLPM